MRQCRLCSKFIVALLLSTLLLPLLSANNSVISEDTTWSGSVTLDADVLVESGSVLTIEPGTVIDGGDGHTIEVSGSLIAEGAHFLSSSTPTAQSSHGQGLWQGIVVTPGGYASLNSVIIENANVGVKSEGSLIADDLTVNDAYFAVKNYGHAHLTNLTTDSIDYDAVLNQGVAIIEDAELTNSSAGIYSDGTLTAAKINMGYVGSGIVAISGLATVDSVAFSNVSVGLSSSLGVKFVASNVTGNHLSLLVDMADSNDFTLTTASVTGNSLVKASAATKTTLRNVSFVYNGVGQDTVVTQHCLGLCVFDNLSITNSTRGIALSGSGHHAIISSDIGASEYGIRATGNGNLSIDNSNISATASGLITRNTNTFFSGDNQILMQQSDAIGIDFLGGIHQIDGLTISKQYESYDTSSIGLQAWYTDIQAASITTENFSTGITMRSSEYIGEVVANIGGNSIGTELIDSSGSIDLITTKYQKRGVLLSESSTLSMHHFVGELHDQPLEVGLNSVVYALDFTTINTNPSYSDATGQGALYYGYNVNLEVTTNISDYFTMTNVKFIDADGNAVRAIINTNTFQMTTDENGDCLIPLFSAGSLVIASVQGTGVRQLLFGGVAGQVVEIPVIPNGDWVISGSQSITLQSLDSSQPFTGNLTIEGDAVLHLIDMNLQLSLGKVITLRDNAKLTGTNSVIESTTVLLHDASELTSTSSETDLIIDSSVFWYCQGEKSAMNLIITEQLTLGPGCELVIENGRALGEVVVSSTSSLELTAKLDISVVDRGVPINNAIIQFNGVNYVTNTSGEVSVVATARAVDSSGDVIGTNQNVIFQYQSYNELITWNTSSPKTHRFVVSTLEVGEIISRDVTIESIWSPYYLESDLTIPLGRTLTLDDDVVLRISDGVEVSISGSLIAGSATISSTGFGDRWSGLVMESQYSNLALSGTTLLEASPAIAYQGGNFHGDQVSISRSSSSRALIEINEQYGGSFSLTDSSLSDASGACIDVVETSIVLYLVSVQLDRCNGPALRAENAHLAITNTSIGPGSSDGVILTSVEGVVDGLQAIEFNGAGHLIKLDYINHNLLITEVIGTVGGSAGISGANNRALNLESVHLFGAPAIDLDSSAGVISDVTLEGNGYGVGLSSHHGRYSAGLGLDDITLSNYTVGIDLHADGVETTAPLSIVNANISAATGLSIDNYPVSVDSATIDGGIDATGPIVVELVDVALQPELSLYDSASVEFFQTIQLESSYLGVVKPASYSLSAVYSDASIITASADGKNVESVVRLQTRHADVTLNANMVSVQIVANSFGHPLETELLSVFEILALEAPIRFVLRENQPPVIESATPDSATIIMQTLPFDSIVVATDDFDTAENLTYQWQIFDSDGSEVYFSEANEASNRIMLESPGNYLLQIIVIDTNLAQSAEIVPLEVKLLDSDNDYLSTCDDTTWYDLTTTQSCGPDVYDADDDNDGIIDSRDEWPLDSCAWQDTDNDGQPDDLNCPEGLVTELFEDQDDDGDGIPDVLEGSSETSNQFDSLTLILLVIIVVVVGVFISRSRRGLQE